MYKYQVHNIMGAGPLEQINDLRIRESEAAFLKVLDEGWQVVSANPYTAGTVAGVQYLIRKPGELKSTHATTAG